MKKFLYWLAGAGREIKNLRRTISENIIVMLDNLAKIRSLENTIALLRISQSDMEKKIISLRNENTDLHKLVNASDKSTAKKDVITGKSSTVQSQAPSAKKPAAKKPKK